MNYVVFGENVRKYRKLANMAQESLAEMCDCSIGHIGHIENGNNKPSLDVAVKIANLLGVTIDQLNSYKSQVQHYTDFINNRKDWVLVDIHADKAILVRRRKTEMISNVL